MSIVQEYRKDLKLLRQQRVREDLKKNETDKSVVGSMISSTEYSLYWIETGFERPLVDNSPTKLSKGKREQLWGEIEHAKGIEQGVWDIHSWEESEEDVLTEKQTDRMIDVDSIMSKFSNQELNVFYLRHQALFEVENIAEELGITEKAVEKTLERINGKIKTYFDSKYNQLALFA